MKEQHFYTDGNECKEGDCLKAPDHRVQFFNITISSIDAVTPEALKTLIQSKYEVTDINLTDRISYHPK